MQREYACMRTYYTFICSRIFVQLQNFSYGEVTMNGEGLQILPFARHSWPLSSEGSISCLTYCDTGRSSSRSRDTHTFCRAFISGAVHFTTKVYRGWDSNTQPSACDENAPTDCGIAATHVLMKSKYYYLLIEVICRNIQKHSMSYSTS